MQPCSLDRLLHELQELGHRLHPCHYLAGLSLYAFCHLYLSGPTIVGQTDTLCSPGQQAQKGIGVGDVPIVDELAGPEGW